MNWPMVAVHSVLLKNGNLLIWDGWQNPEPTAVWNATSQTFPTTINAPGSIFCSGNVHLPDGRILTAGGDGVFTTGNLGLADTTIFDPATGTWKRVADMNRPRWYPSLTELADGRYVAISGNSTNQTTWADTPEVYDPAADTWTLLTGVSTPQVHEEEYPFSYLRPERQGLHHRAAGGQLLLPRRRPPRRGRRSAAPAAWSTARRSCTARARSSTAAARRASRRRRRPRPTRPSST